MGWSCRAEVGTTMDAMGKAGLFLGAVGPGGDKFFVEVSSREFADGHASCELMRILPGSEKPDGSAQCVKVGSFAIKPDGTLPRAPSWLRALVAANS